MDIVACRRIVTEKQFPVKFFLTIATATCPADHPELALGPAGERAGNEVLEAHMGAFSEMFRNSMAEHQLQTNGDEGEGSSFGRL